ncbi:uncharacterized protein LOC143529882 [Bidens hawaiensis]|uniref:uncharacterized protein LOC143529882 n=1 Tax=Bidens hawaiensis TaxID=980011 RepID=UPI00404A86BD
MVECRRFGVMLIWGWNGLGRLADLGSGEHVGQEVFSMSTVVTDRHFILTKGVIKGVDQEFCIMNVYASQGAVEKRDLWDQILNVKEGNEGIWILLGDFNSVKNPEERHNTFFNPVIARDFNSFIFNANLSEFYMKGGKFTFSVGNKCSKLDRVLVCHEFFNRWPEACFKVLPKFLSDHRPIVLSSKFSNFGPKPFRFFNSWLERKSIDEVVKKACFQFQAGGLPDLKLSLKLKSVRDKIRMWWEEVKYKEEEELSVFREEMGSFDNLA